MIPLAFYTAIFYKIASCAILQFDIINSGDAAGGTTHHHIISFRFICTTHHKN